MPYDALNFITSGGLYGIMFGFVSGVLVTIAIVSLFIRNRE